MTATIKGDPKKMGKNNPFYGKHHTEETKQKISEANKGMVSFWKGKKRPEISGINHPMYGKPPSKERIEKQRQKMKGRRLSPETEFQRKYDRIIRKCFTCSKDMIVRENSIKKYCCRHCQYKRKVSPETRERLSISIKAFYQKHPEKRKRFAKFGNKNPMKRPDVIAKNIKSRTRGPNYKEDSLNRLLQIHFPNEWKYVGDGEVMFGRKNPDFINVNGKKKIIELFGRFWHKQNDEQKRIAYFKQYGFDCLVVWVEELERWEELIEKISNFVEVD